MCVKQEFGPFVEQYSKTDFEIFTIDNLYTDNELDIWIKYIENSDNRNRPFTYSNFKNGKMIMPDLSSLMYNRIKPYLPTTYVNVNNISSTFLGTINHIMYAKIDSGQSFPIHTDTGCEYTKTKESKFTVLTYLNDDFTGGYTQFYDDTFIKTALIKPLKGRTLIFDIDLFHAGNEVIFGSKYWIGTELVCSK